MSKFSCGIVTAVLIWPRLVQAQAGPPFLTNDPGTPGNGNWEINISSQQTITQGQGNYQLPQFDLNFGVGDRLQLTAQVPYVLQTRNGERLRTGWSNALLGIKWRWLDLGEDSWQASIFPQAQTTAPRDSVLGGIASSGSRILLPVEVARRVGPINIDAEVGYFPPRHGQSEQFVGWVMGHDFTARLEFDLEFYDDRVSGITGGSPGGRSTTLGLGGRYRLNDNFIALFMAAHGLNGSADGRIETISYAGIQVLIH